MSSEEHTAAAAIHGLQQRLLSFGYSNFERWGHWHAAQTLRQGYPQLERGGWRRGGK
jgi:hypothetical protein